MEEREKESSFKKRPKREFEIGLQKIDTWLTPSCAKEVYDRAKPDLNQVPYVK